MSPNSPLFEGNVGLKTAFMWGERCLGVCDDRVELSLPDRPAGQRSIFKLEHVTLSPIIRHHRHYEFTLFSGETGVLRRYRLRTSELHRTEYIHSLIQRVKMFGGASVRGSKDFRPSGSQPLLRETSLRGSHRQTVRSISPDVMLSRAKTRVAERENPQYPSFLNDFPHVTLNLLVVMIVLVTILVAPVFNSILITLTFVLGLALGVAVVLNHYSIDIPLVHVLVTISPMTYESNRLLREQTSFESTVDESIEGSPIEDREERGSRSSSINELGYSTPTPGSPEHQHSMMFVDHRMSVLFSESSKFLSSSAASEDYNQCYSTLWSVSEAVLRLLATQPREIGPGCEVRLTLPSGMELQDKVLIVPDDIEHTKAEWNVIRNKNGLRVLTSKLSSTMKKWPIISAVSTLDANFEDIYRAVSVTELMKKADEFLGDSQVVAYKQLIATSTTDETTSDEELKSESELDPHCCPILIKHQQMKSVWPVQPRDYLAIQTGFSVSTNDGRRGKFLISKSVDPHPQDPYPEGKEGFVRGALTASAFLLIQNKHQPDSATDIWTFLHCDMRGNLSGVGKIADFITQSQMPKFLAKLEAAAASRS